MLSTLSRPTIRGLLVGLAGLVLAAGAAAQPPAHYRTGADGVMLGDSSGAPGATGLVTVGDLCPIAHTKRVRHVTPAQKNRAYAVYGATPQPGVCCEVDHLIPLELGGSNADSNLWPEPYTPKPGAREKDVLETFLHFAACGGTLDLKKAHQQSTADWDRAY